MIRKIAIAATMTALTAAPALAAHCPADAAAIDAALAKMTVSDTLRAEVAALKDTGMNHHNAGQHREAEAALAEAMRKLLTAE